MIECKREMDSNQLAVGEGWSHCWQARYSMPLHGRFGAVFSPHYASGPQSLSSRVGEPLRASSRAIHAERQDAVWTLFSETIHSITRRIELLENHTALQSSCARSEAAIPHWAWPASQQLSPLLFWSSPTCHLLWLFHPMRAEAPGMTRINGHGNLQGVATKCATLTVSVK